MPAFFDNFCRQLGLLAHIYKDETNRRCVALQPENISLFRQNFATDIREILHTFQMGIIVEECTIIKLAEGFLVPGYLKII